MNSPRKVDTAVNPVVNEQSERDRASMMSSVVTLRVIAKYGCPDVLTLLRSEMLRIDREITRRLAS